MIPIYPEFITSNTDKVILITEWYEIMENTVLIDTFSEFLSLWNTIQSYEIDIQIQCWIEYYMSKYPELRDLQINDYLKNGLD